MLPLWDMLPLQGVLPLKCTPWSLGQALLRRSRKLELSWEPDRLVLGSIDPKSDASTKFWDLDEPEERVQEGCLGAWPTPVGFPCEPQGLSGAP